MSNIRIGLDGDGDVVVAFRRAGAAYKSFYMTRAGETMGFGSDKIAYESIRKELTQEQIKIVFDTIREILE